MGRNETVMGVRVGVMAVGIALCSGVCSCDLKRGAAGNGCEAAAEGAAATQAGAGVAATQAGADVKGEAQTRVMAVEVVDGKTGKGLAGATLRVQAFSGKVVMESTAKSDEDGKANVSLPSKGVTLCNLQAEKNGYVPMRAQWPGVGQAMTGEVLVMPESYVFRLPVGTVIGGRVVDDTGQGVEGATVALHLRAEKWGGAGQVPGQVPGQTANQVPNILFRTLKTGADGKWRFTQAPEGFGEASVGVYHMGYDSGKGYGWYPMKDVAEGALRDGSWEWVLDRGVRIEGVVLGADGKPVAGAVIGLGEDRFGSNSLPSLRSDKQGKFVAVGPANGKVTLTVTAKGHAPELKEIQLKGEKREVEFRLGQARTLRGRVVDAKGEGVPGVTVYADTWRYARTLNTQMVTDAKGRFEWKQAPADGVEFSMFRTGYARIENRMLVAGEEEATITMNEPLAVKGSVVDAETGKGIGSFVVVRGMADGADRGQVTWMRGGSQEIAGKDGRFEFHVGYPMPGHVVRIEADGYAPGVSRVFKDEEGSVTLELKMKKAKNLRGVVRDVDGKPLAGAEVVVVMPRSQARWTNGVMDKYGRHDLLCAVSDGGGKYELWPQVEPFVLVVMSERGYAEVAGAEAIKGGDIRLKAWGRVEGQLMAGSKPAGMQEVRAGLREASYVYDAAKPRVSNALTATTNWEGRFVLERVPAGKVRVSRSESGAWTEVEVVGGKTTEVSVGGMGRPVVGRVEIPEAIKTGAKYWLSANLSTKVDYSQPTPAGFDGFSQEEKMAWRGKFTASQEGKAHALAVRRQEEGMRSYSFEPGEDGGFRIEDVPAGRYVLSVILVVPWKGEVIARGDAEVVVPEMAGGRSDEALDVGVVSVRGGEEKEEGGK